MFSSSSPAQIAQSWPAGLQIQIPLFHNPYRALVFPFSFCYRTVRSLPGALEAQIPLIPHPSELSCFPSGSCTELLKLACRPPGPGRYPPQNSRVFVVVPFIELSRASLQASRSRFRYSTPPIEVLCFPYGFPLQNYTKLACSPPGPDSIIHTPWRTVVFSLWLPLQSCVKLACRLPGQISLFHTPYRTFVFALGLPLQSSSELAWSSPGRDSIDPHLLQSFRAFPIVFFAGLSEAGLQASRSRFH